MEYRPLGRTSLSVSAISLGTEYLVKSPTETITGIVDAAIDGGINFFDVLFSEPNYRDAFGLAFQGRRDKVLITGHLPVSDTVARCADSFEDHLKRLRVDAVDFVFVSSCDGEERYNKAMQPGEHYELAARLVRQGKARFIGFSSHTVPVTLTAARSGLFDMLMFPINPAFDTLPGETGADDLKKLWDDAYIHQPDAAQDGILPARRRLYQECAARGIGMIAIKPFAAGWLFRPDLATGFTPLNLLHYALSQPGVSCVIPGISSLDQLTVDLAYFNAPDAEKDYALPLSQTRWNYRGTCMYCNHCQPCRAGIDISEVNKLLNLASSGELVAARQAYHQLAVLASQCQECGDCLERCPFGVEVISRMQEAVVSFENAN